MIDCKIFQDASSFKMVEFTPKLTTLTPGQKEALKELWMSEDSKTKVGIWECTEGIFTADRTQMAEYCHIISGDADVFNDAGMRRHLGPGDVLILPLGWRGQWQINKHMRKLYVLNAP